MGRKKKLINKTDVPQYAVSNLALGDGATVSLATRFAGVATNYLFSGLRVGGGVVANPGDGMRMTIGDTVFTGDKSETGLTVSSGGVSFDTPLKLTVPAEWFPMPYGVTYFDWNNAALEGNLSIADISVFDSNGMNRTSKTNLLLSRNRLVSIGGLIVILR